MKKRLIEIVYGFLFGISCLIPGYDGGTMLLILGVYESFTLSLSKFSTKPIEAFKELIFYGIGTVFGAIFGVLTVVVCLNKFPLITASFFVGLVLATIPMVVKNIRKQKINLSSILSLVISIAIALVMAFGDMIGLPSISFDNINIWMFIYILVLSTIASGSMIIPAASGMTILLVFGMYAPLMGVFDEILKGIVDLNFTPILDNILVLIPFGIGLVVGIIGVAKIISKLFKTHAGIVWYGILGFLVVSPIAIYKDAYVNRALPIIDSIKENIKLNIVLSVLFLIIGFVLLLVLDNLSQKKKSKKIEFEENKDVA